MKRRQFLAAAAAGVAGTALPMPPKMEPVEFKFADRMDEPHKWSGLMAAITVDGCVFYRNGVEVGRNRKRYRNSGIGTNQ